MTLDDFKQKVLPKLITDFETAYLEAQRDEGERDYPSDQNEDEWVDAFVTFLDADDEED